MLIQKRPKISEHSSSQDKGILLESETESSEEEATPEDLAFLDDENADTESDGDWVSNSI